MHDDFSKPKVNKDNPNKWYVYYNYRVPNEILHLFKRGWKQFKVYQGINRIPLNQRDQAANELCSDVHYSLRHGFNPFEGVLEMKEHLENEKNRSKHEFLCSEVLPIFIQSRVARKLDKTSILAYGGTVDWLMRGISNIPAGEVKYTHISDTIATIAKERNWSATTINKEWDFVQTIFNWMVLEDYMFKNPIKGKVEKLPTDKTKHRWYDRETAIKVKEAILKSKSPWLINVCQFTYETWIRSKQELMNIRVGDIDTELHMIHFRKEWAKNSSDQSRVYSDDFHDLVLSMKIDKLPKDYYVFSSSGAPGPKQCGVNFFSRNWSIVREDLGLSDEYTIYGWKHTAIVHAVMKEVKAEEISHKARHEDRKTTEDYCRDYDISLKFVYKPEDLVFWPEKNKVAA